MNAQIPSLDRMLDGFLEDAKNTSDQVLPELAELEGLFRLSKENPSSNKLLVFYRVQQTLIFVIKLEK